MAKLWIDCSEGRYSVRQFTAEEADRRNAFEVVDFNDDDYDAYLRHCDSDAGWQALWREISNARAAVRDEKKRQDEIARLRGELEEARRQLHRARVSVRYEEYTCVFPTPGCKIDVLPPAWRERAAEIVEQYRADHAAEGMTRQGCCCGHEHEKLDPATCDALVRAGFIVEHDAEEL